MSGDLKGYPMQGVYTSYGLEREMPKPKTNQVFQVIEKIYDPESGDGALECVKRAADGKFELVIYRNADDLTLYGLTASELAAVGRRLQEIARGGLSHED